MSSIVTQSLTLEFDVLRRVDEPVHDGVSKSRLGNVFVPSVQGQLGGDDDGFLFIPVLEQSKQSKPCFRCQCLQAKVIEYEQIFLPELIDELLVCSLKTRLCQLVRKVVHA